jgi:hypothetical protein
VVQDVGGYRRQAVDSQGRGLLEGHPPRRQRQIRIEPDLGTTIARPAVASDRGPDTSSTRLQPSSPASVRYQHRSRVLASHGATCCRSERKLRWVADVNASCGGLAATSRRVDQPGVA